MICMLCMTSVWGNDRFAGYLTLFDADVPKTHVWCGGGVGLLRAAVAPLHGLRLYYRNLRHGISALPPNNDKLANDEVRS